uniref:Ovule protein n=1 Tax=Heterorhabditis bacteriophora TaxID=37862 RepID=A0A1I7WEZ6_HETBA
MLLKQFTSKNTHTSPEGEPRLKKALKNREKNSPINLLFWSLPNLPSKCIETYRCRNPDLGLFRTSAGSAHSHNK